MESSLDEWLGANDAADSRQLLEAASMAREEDVNVRIKKAREEFMKQKKSVRERLANESVKWEPKHITDRFRGKYDKHWKMNCPACECFAIMAGDQSREIISEEREDSGIWETVDHQFIGEEFHCPTCELTLLGNVEIKAAQLVDGYWEQDDRDITRERDYGSD